MFKRRRKPILCFVRRGRRRGVLFDYFDHDIDYFNNFHFEYYIAQHDDPDYDNNLAADSDAEPDPLDYNDYDADNNDSDYDDFDQHHHADDNPHDNFDFNSDYDDNNYSPDTDTEPDPPDNYDHNYTHDNCDDVDHEHYHPLDYLNDQDDLLHIVVIDLLDNPHHNLDVVY